MKILLSCLVIIILFVIIIYKFKSGKVRCVEKFFEVNQNFKDSFPMAEEYKLYLRETGDRLTDYIVPDNFKYTYLKEELKDKINNEGIIQNCIPNVIFKVTIPNEKFKKTYMKYTISIDDNDIEGKYTNFLYYHCFNLESNFESYFNFDENDNTSRISKLETHLKNQNFKELSNIDTNFNTIYELPTRLEGDTRDSNNQIKLHMLMFYFKFRLEINIYSETNDELSLDEFKVFYEIGGEEEGGLEGEEIELKKIDDNKKDNATKYELTPGYNYIKPLFNKMVNLLIDEYDTVDLNNKNGFNREQIDLKDNKKVFIYEDIKKPYHCKKIKKIVSLLFYYFQIKLTECEEEPQNIVEVDDEKYIENILEYYVTHDAALVSPYDTFINDKFTPNKNIPNQKEDEKNKKKHQSEYLEENKILGRKMLVEYDKLSTNLKNKVDTLNIENLYEDIYKRLNPTEKKKKKFYERTLTYKLDLRYLSPEKTTSKSPSTDLSEEEKEINKMNKFSTNEKLLYLIQKDLRKVLRNRRGNFFDQREFKISNHFKKELLVQKKNLTSLTDLKRKNAEESIDYVKFLMDMIKTGRVDIINEIVDFDVNKSRFILIKKLKNLNDENEGFNTKSNMIGNYIKSTKYRDNFKKNMNDIYKRYMDFKIKVDENKRTYDNSFNYGKNFENDTVYEEFNNPIQHKHADSGQINFLSGTNKVNRDDFEKIDWLKKPENQRLVASYQFLSEGQKKGILKEIDDMESNLYQLKDFTETNYGDMKEKLNMLEEKAKEELRLKEEEANMTDLEKSVRDFQFKEQEQELKMKNMNKKIDKLEKEQKGLNLARFDKINSVRSMGDGQVLSVFNLKDNQYQIQANSGCVKQGKKSLEMAKCGNQKDQKFNLHHINNSQEYNKHLLPGTQIEEDYAEIAYPFHLITPSDNKKKCVSMHGNKMSMVDCADSKYHRFETFRKFKKCDSKYGN